MNSPHTVVDTACTQKQLYWAGAFVVLFVVAFWNPLKGIVNTWATNDDYSYGYLIPFVSAYLFWDMRDKAKGLIFKPAWAVLPVLLLFTLVSVYGVLGSSGNIARPAVPVMFMLIFAFAFGLEAFKRFALPLGFLVFIVPLPAILDRTLGVFLKSVSSQLGGLLIRMSGMSVHVSGNVIDLGVTQLQVVDACSGLRFVFPLLALGIIYAYFFEKVRWKQLICVIATVPIAIVTNGLRIGITAILTHYIGPEMAEGFFHDFSGWAIFMVAFVFLFALGRVLRFFPPRRKTSDEAGTNQNQEAVSESKTYSDSKYAYTVSIVILATIAFLGTTTGNLPPVQLKDGIGAFPISLNGWNGYKQSLDPIIIAKSGAEEAFSAYYRNPANDSVYLYIGYRSTSFLENYNFFHSPTVCLPSSGWKELETSTHVIKNVHTFGELKVTKMLIEKMDSRQLVYFWFQTKKWATHDKNINRFHLTLHALQRDNTHDIFARTITPISSNESFKTAETRMDNFVRDAISTMQQFLLDNIKIQS